MHRKTQPPENPYRNPKPEETFPKAKYCSQQTISLNKNPVDGKTAP
jgi:hypothetical protein